MFTIKVSLNTKSFVLEDGDCSPALCSSVSRRAEGPRRYGGGRCRRSPCHAFSLGQRKAHGKEHQMSWKRILYVLLVAVVAGVAALSGAVAGGTVVYQAVQARANLPPPIQEVLPASNTKPVQTLILNTTQIETTITQAVQKVGPAVVTVVGTIPGQSSFFGSTGA